MHIQTCYFTVVLSVIHPGTSYSKTIELSNLLKPVSCGRLILNGNIMDGWHLWKAGNKKWQAKHSDFFKVIRRMMENFGMEVIYVYGNHDDFLDNPTLGTFYNIKIVKEYILETYGKYNYVKMGDVFDHVTTQMKWLAQLRDVGNTFLLWANSFYNLFCAVQGKPYYSLSQVIKQKVKFAVSYLSDFDKILVEFVCARKYDGVICEQNHSPANTHCSEIHFLNSGNWVENLSALTEDINGNWNVVEYRSISADKSEKNQEFIIIHTAS